MSKCPSVLASLVGAWLATCVFGCGAQRTHNEAGTRGNGGMPKSQDDTGAKSLDSPAKNLVTNINFYKFITRDGNAVVAVEVLHDDLEIDSALAPSPFSEVGLSSTGGAVFEVTSPSRTVFYIWGAGQDFSLLSVILRTKAGTVYTLDHFDGIRGNVDLRASIHYESLPTYPSPTI